jgi:hypothetical protein
MNIKINYKLLDDGKVVDIYSGNKIQTTKSKGVILVDEASLLPKEERIKLIKLLILGTHVPNI